MKKFLIILLAFFIPVLCVLAGLEYMVRKAPNEYQYKAQWMEKNADRVETLILGTSHAFYGINPSYLGPNAFSLAASAQSLQYDEFLFINSLYFFFLFLIFLYVSFREKILNIAEGTVKSRLSRARDELKSMNLEGLL